MENVENDNLPMPPTRSNLSDWVGALVVKDSSLTEGVRVGDDKVVPDHLAFGDRLFNFFEPENTHVLVGPGTTPTRIWSLWSFLQANHLFKTMGDLYEGVSYDAVTFRFSLSNPKSLAGSMIVGGGPFNNWFGDVAFDTYSDLYGQNAMTRQGLMLSPESHFITYGEAKDVVFTLPWQCCFPYWRSDDIAGFVSQTEGSTLPVPGTPMIYCQQLGSTFMSSVNGTATLRVYVNFTNLRWVGPRTIKSLDRAPVFSKQSGLEGVAAAALTTAVAVAAESGAEILSDALGITRVQSGEPKTGEYDLPKAVQFSFAGDTTVCGPPGTTPVFTNWMKEPPIKHPLMEFLREPQWIMSTTTMEGPKLYLANPVAPNGVEDISGPTQQCTWFRFFSKINNYWRGTINFHFVIAGHPMVETRYHFRIAYGPDYAASDEAIDQNSVLTGICNGVYHVKIPMPNLNLWDHFPVTDEKDLTLASLIRRSSSLLIGGVSVVSTMLDVAPVIPVEVFISAGDDFQFFQPRPVGFYDVVDAEFAKQVQLSPPDQTFQTRAKTQESLSMMLSCDNVEDYMSIWSRALPYSSYDVDDEPTPTMTRSMDPCWWPSSGSSAAYTINVNNSWFVTNDYISYISSCFLYYRGSIGVKVIVDANRLEGPSFIYCSLDARQFLRQPANNPYTYSTFQIPPKSNFGSGCAVTYAPAQPVLELTLPQRSACEWGLNNPQQLLSTRIEDSMSPFNGTLATNIVLQETNADLQDALFRKAGPDFRLAVRTWVPPPTLWVSNGYDWS